MSVGFVMLVHEGFLRTAQVARHLASHGCPVVIHVDKRVPNEAYQPFVDGLADLENIKFSKRHRCEWGKWSLVAATQDASAMMLDSFADVRHVYLSSGTCLPLRPIEDLVHYLDQRPTTDFIESVTTEDAAWTVGGLDTERFTLRFPFSWKRQRRLFDRYVSLQRRVKFKRKTPSGIVPHLGSQWWCLTRKTLSAILEDPSRRTYDAYFKRVWIPDEGYFQSLVRKHSSNVESRSLTLSKFDYHGKPHTFYDDHLQLLRRSDCFVARKIWRNADQLYDEFLSDRSETSKTAEPNPGKIDRIFSKATDLRANGRDGLYMQSRFPVQGKGKGKTSAPYSVFEGFSDLFQDFDGWLSQLIDARIHGHLYAPDRAEFADGQDVVAGGLSSYAAIRDYDPNGFLTNLIWNTRGVRQCFMHGPRDNQKIGKLISSDPNAQISVISGAWAVTLFRSADDFSNLRREAARLQRIEAEHIKQLRAHNVKARVRIWTMADFVQNPLEPLQAIVDDIGSVNVRRLTKAPQMHDLTGFSQFLQTLKNQGMNPHLMGDFPSEPDVENLLSERKKTYLVK